jgi:hypothetical protein
MHWILTSKTAWTHNSNFNIFNIISRSFQFINIKYFYISNKKLYKGNKQFTMVIFGINWQPPEWYLQKIYHNNTTQILMVCAEIYIECSFLETNTIYHIIKQELYKKCILGLKVMVFNSTFNTISGISWQSVLHQLPYDHDSPSIHIEFNRHLEGWEKQYHYHSILKKN